MHYFYIEFRFHRYPKEYLRSLIIDLSRRFKVKGALKYRPVPHMTLYGPSQAKSLSTVLSRIKKVAKNYSLIPFDICDFEAHDGRGGKVIGCRVHASAELINLRRELALELNKVVKPENRQPWDNGNDYWFHSTLAMKDIDQKYEQIWSYLKRKEKPNINQHLLRITVLNNRRKIECEYDLMFHRWLTRREALNKRLWSRTVNRLRQLQGLSPEAQSSRFNFLRKLFRLFKGNK